ncbi:MAG: VOC family protein [Synoicihabitans sp.]
MVGMMKTLTLDHIQLAMPPGGEDRARAFWGDLLGMTEDPKPEPLARRGGCWFRSGSVRLHVGVEQEFAPQRKAHPAFTVEDLDEVAPVMEAAGHPIKWDDALPDRKRFYVADPFGNRIEFMRDGDGFSQR